MEMLKGVPCFTDSKAPSTKISDFFPLTKRISMNMGGDPPSFVSAQFPFALSSLLCFALASTGMDGVGDCRSGNLFYLAPLFK